MPPDADAATRPTTHRTRDKVLVGRYLVLAALYVAEHRRTRVVAAYDPVLDRRVAIKLHRCTGSTRGAILQATRLLVRVVHPNVLGVYDAGTCDDELFVVTELVDGPSLSVWAQQQSAEEIVDVFAMLARGLDAVHRADIVHGDVKPDNIVMRAGGQPCLVDFELATSCDEMAAVRGGTQGFIAPELLAGSPASPASDQFALATSLVWCLSRGNLEDDWVPRVPRHLRGVVRRALATNPTSRWPSMAELAHQLQRPRRARKRTLVLATALAAAVAGWSAHGCANVHDPIPATVTR